MCLRTQPKSFFEKALISNMNSVLETNRMMTVSQMTDFLLLAKRRLLQMMTI